MSIKTEKLSDTIEVSKEFSDQPEKKISEAEERGKKIVGAFVDKMAETVYKGVGGTAIGFEKGVGLVSIGLEKVNNALDRFDDWCDRQDANIERMKKENEEKFSMNFKILKEKVSVLGVGMFAKMERNSKNREIENEKKRADREKSRVEGRQKRQLLVPRIKDAWLGFKEKSIEDKIKELQKQQEIVSAQRGAVGENIKNIEEDATNDIEQIDKKLEETTEDLRKTTKMEELLGTLSSRLSEAVEAKEQKYPKKDANIEGDQE